MAGNRFDFATLRRRAYKGSNQRYTSFPMVEVFQNVETADTDSIASTAVATAGAAITTFDKQPYEHFGDSYGARCVNVIFGGVATSLITSTVTIVGTNINGEAITEALTFIAGQTTASVGSKAFKSLTSVTYPAQAGAGATIAVGVNNKLGLSEYAVHVVGATLNSVTETTAPTVAYSQSDIESNTVDLNSALNGSDVHVTYHPLMTD